jgi:hypothetical protein
MIGLPALVDNQCDWYCTHAIMQLLSRNTIYALVLLDALLDL